MSKSHMICDVRASSYDAAGARPEGYTGTADEVLAQIRAEPDDRKLVSVAADRIALLRFLGLHQHANDLEDSSPRRRQIGHKVTA